MLKRFVYADNAATTQISEPVFQAMLPYLREEYGNASSIYALGRRAGQAIKDARETVAKAFHAQPDWFMWSRLPKPFARTPLW